MTFVDRWGYMCVSITHFMLFVATVILHILAWSSDSSPVGLYQSGRRQFWERTGLTFMDPKTMMWISIAIYMYELLWIIYNVMVNCRPHKIELSLRRVMHFAVLDMSALAHICIVVMLALQDMLPVSTHRGSILLQLAVALFFNGAFAYGAYVTMARKRELWSSSVVDHWLIRGLYLNGMAASATWNVILFAYQTSLILAENTNMGTTPICLTLLAIITINMSAALVLGVVYSVHTPDFVITPYLVSIATTSAMLETKFDDRDVSVIVTAGVCGISAVFFLLKVAIDIGRERDFESNKRDNHLPKKLSLSMPTNIPMVEKGKEIQICIQPRV